jgi:poly(3-hydroxybutyrate) depolymerase
MKLLTLVACVLFASCVKTSYLNGPDLASDNSLDTVTETALPTYRYVYTTIGTDVRNGYAEVLPALYYKTTKSYPLIVFNHGVGENSSTGKSLSALSCCGLPYHAARGQFPARFLASDGKYYSYIAVCPQYYNRPSGAQVQQVVAYAMNKYRVDPSRVYVVGLSQGGGVTMEWAKWYGEKAAAIFPACPGLYPRDSSAQRIAKKNLPIWWQYGSADNLVPPSQGYTWESLVDKYNPVYVSQTKLTVWPNLTHNQTWAKAFNPLTKVDGKNAYEWLLQYKRDGNMPPVAVVVGGDRSIPLSWNYYATVWGTSSKDSDGWITRFKWSQVSGPASTINTPTSSSTKLITPTAGIYTYQLTVTDNKGATANKLFKITMQ